METTMELLNRFAASGPDYMIAKHLRISPTTISMARKNGRLSPELAARLAVEIYIDKSDAERETEVQHWVAVAVAEQMPPEKKDWLMQHIGCYRREAAQRSARTGAKS